MRWTCTSCQHDNLIVSNFPLYPDKVKWRCGGSDSNVVVYRPDKLVEEAMFEYMSVHSEGRKAKWGMGKNHDRDSENNQSLGMTST
jgi:hypothetical protein